MHGSIVVPIAAWTLMTLGCTARGIGQDQDAGLAPSADAGVESSVADGATSAEAPPVYAHSPYEMYRLDPESFDVDFIGTFQWPAGMNDTMADIAVDREGRVYGVSARHRSLYEIDPSDASTRLLSRLESDHTYNALSFVPTPTGEGLIGVTSDGVVHHLETETGIALELGRFGHDLGSSGDIVYVDGVGLYATVEPNELDGSPGDGDDLLARIDRYTFDATIIGPTRHDRIWGLGYIDGNLLGFTSEGPQIDDGGQLLRIDPSTGVATETGHVATAPWWGAGVTTRARSAPMPLPQ